MAGVWKRVLEKVDFAVLDEPFIQYPQLLVSKTKAGRRENSYNKIEFWLPCPEFHGERRV